MANTKPTSRNWNDVHLTIATVSMVFTLIFWNLFAGPDREMALKRAQEQAARDQAERERIAQEQAAQAAAQTQSQTQTQVQPVAPQVVVQPTPMSGPILLGGSAPQTRIFVSGGGGNGGGVSGGGVSGGGGSSGGGGGTGGS